MKRRTLLQGLGTIGIGSILPIAKSPRAAAATVAAPSCFLTPAETEGPYYFNANLIRRDITEGKTGTPLRMVLSVVNQECVPIPNAMVDVWHCDKDGLYSGYAGQGDNQQTSTVGQTFIRGIQMTDAAGNAEFTTIYPGWYPGRATHIHFKVHLNAKTYVTSQFAFPESTNTAIYTTALYSARGQNPQKNSTDMVFRESSVLDHLLMEVAPEGDGYLGTLTIGINAVAVASVESETAGQFTLEQNFPNPFGNATTITFALAQSSKVELAVFDVTGREIARLLDERMGAGEHKVDWTRGSADRRLPAGTYIYQLTVENSAGEFRQSKVMTVL